jgi:hypothetical protein
MDRPDAHQYRFQSGHGIASSLLYFYLIKNRMAIYVLPVLAIDMMIWGPYYSSGFLSGFAFALAI